MKKILVLMVSLIIFSSAVKAGVPPIDVTYNDGIYHIVLKGDKIKRHVKFISSESLEWAVQNSFFTADRLGGKLAFASGKSF